MTQKKFNKLRITEKRIAIAKDVVARITDKQYTAERGTWARVCLSPKNAPYNKDGELMEAKNCSLQDKLVEDKTKCKVCALGGLMMSRVAVSNDFKLSGLGRKTHFRFR
jgi:hypothetical protein